MARTLIILTIAATLAFGLYRLSPQLEPQTVENSPAAQPRTRGEPATVPAPVPTPAAIKVPPTVVAKASSRTVPGLPDDRALLDKYRAKLNNPEYIAWMNAPGIPTGYQHFPEEQAIKTIRTRLAAQLTLSPGEGAIPIPIHTDKAPLIDGRIGPTEWSQATRLAIGINGSRTSLYLMSDGVRLYLASDVPGDRTPQGFDQFRFYYHVDLSPYLVNERIHVRPGRDDILGGIRQTRVRWQGAPPANDNERWKKFPISDWRIYRKARGRSAINRHRQYEAVLDLDEAGLHPGVPFRSFVEVETDPTRSGAGKFQHRVYLGELGSRGAPVWLIIGGTDKFQAPAEAAHTKTTTPAAGSGGG